MSYKLSVLCCLLIFVLGTPAKATKPVRGRVLFSYEGKLYEYPKDKKILKKLYGQIGWPKSTVKQVHRLTGNKKFQEYIQKISRGEKAEMPNFHIRYGASEKPKGGEYVLLPGTKNKDSKWVKFNDEKSFEELSRRRLYGNRSESSLSEKEQKKLERYRNRIVKRNPGRFPEKPVENSVNVSSFIKGNDMYFGSFSNFVGGLARNSTLNVNNTKINQNRIGNDGILEKDVLTTPQNAWAAGFAGFGQSLFDSNYRDNLPNGIHDLRREISSSTKTDSRYTNVNNPSLRHYLSTEQGVTSILRGINNNGEHFDAIRNAFVKSNGANNTIDDFLRQYSADNKEDITRVASIFDVTTNFSGTKKELKNRFGKDIKPYLKNRKNLRNQWRQNQDGENSYNDFIQAINSQNGFGQNTQMANASQGGHSNLQESLGLLNVKENRNGKKRGDAPVPPTVILAPGFFDQQNETTEKPQTQQQPETQQQVQPQAQPTCQPTCQPTYNNCGGNYRPCYGYRRVRRFPILGAIFRRRRCR